MGKMFRSFGLLFSVFSNLSPPLSLPLKNSTRRVLAPLDLPDQHVFPHARQERAQGQRCLILLEELELQVVLLEKVAASCPDKPQRRPEQRKRGGVLPPDLRPGEAQAGNCGGCGGGGGGGIGGGARGRPPFRRRRTSSSSSGGGGSSAGACAARPPEAEEDGFPRDPFTPRPLVGDHHLDLCGLVEVGRGGSGSGSGSVSASFFLALGRRWGALSEKKVDVSDGGPPGPRRVADDESQFCLFIYFGVVVFFVMPFAVRVSVPRPEGGGRERAKEEEKKNNALASSSAHDLCISLSSSKVSLSDAVASLSLMSSIQE